jgi:hypothetical protein
MIRNISFIIILCLLFVGCTTQPTNTPTQDLNQLSTEVAATVYAQITTESMQQATQIAETQSVQQLIETSLPSTSTPIPDTPTPVPDTPTPTDTLTPTQPPSATPTPVIGDPKLTLGTPTWRATFDKSTWYLFSDPQSSFEIEDGKLVITAKQANNFETWSLSWPDLENFYIEVTVTTGSQCSSKDRYGMIVRAPDTSHGYLFGISCDGAFRVRAWDGKAFTTLHEWETSDRIEKGPDQTNRLGVLANGEELSLYINGVLAAEIDDDTYPAGTFGLFIAANQTAGFTVEVSQVMYWNLP